MSQFHSGTSGLGVGEQLVSKSGTRLSWSQGSVGSHSMSQGPVGSGVREKLVLKSETRLSWSQGPVNPVNLNYKKKNSSKIFSRQYIRWQHTLLFSCEDEKRVPVNDFSFLFFGRYLDTAHKRRHRQFLQVIHFYPFHEFRRSTKHYRDTLGHPVQ